MDIPVLVTQHLAGFRAATGGPLDLSADGPTADAAVAALRALVVAKMQSGQLHSVTVTDVASLQAAARRLGESPVFEDWVQAVEEYRRINSTVPDDE